MLPGVSDNLLMDIEHIIKTSVKKITIEMKNFLLRLVFDAIKKEFRHAKISEIKDASLGIYDEHDVILKKIINKQDFKKDEWADFVKMALHGFKYLTWKPSYGGEAWVKICKAWLNLHESSSMKRDIECIDFIMSLEHNTGTIFDKSDEMDYNGFQWIKIALDAKFLKGPNELSLMSNIDEKIIAMINRILGLGEPLERTNHSAKIALRKAFKTGPSKNWTKIIKKDADASFDYALFILKAPFPEGEEAIKQNKTLYALYKNYLRF